MNAAQDSDHGRYPSGNPRRHSEAVFDLAYQGSVPASRGMKRYRRIQADIPRYYQTEPASATYASHSFARSNSSGSVKRPLSFIANFASKVKNAFEGWQDSSVNRNSGRFGIAEFESNSDSSPNLQKKFSQPRLRRTHEQSVASRPHSAARKSYSSGSVNSVNPWFEELEKTFSTPSSPELERTPRAYFDDACNDHSDVSSEQACDKIKACDLTKIDGDLNILVIGADGVGKSALIVRYLTKRFIGEYASNSESIYDHVISIDGKEVTLHIWDSGIPHILQKQPEKDLDKFDISEFLSFANSSSRTSTSSTSSAYDNRTSYSSFEEDSSMTSSPVCERKPAKKKGNARELNNNRKAGNEMDMRLAWADAVIVVYSICDTESYDCARDIVRYTTGQTVRGHATRDSDSFLPVFLIGNKSDLSHRRRVERKSPVSFAIENGCKACVELSVSRDFERISEVFNDVIRDIYRSKTPSKPDRIKAIVRTVSGGFTHKRNLSL